MTAIQAEAPVNNDELKLLTEDDDFVQYAKDFRVVLRKCFQGTLQGVESLPKITIPKTTIPNIAIETAFYGGAIPNTLPAGSDLVHYCLAVWLYMEPESTSMSTHSAPNVKNAKVALLRLLSSTDEKINDNQRLQYFLGPKWSLAKWNDWLPKILDSTQLLNKK